MDIFYWSPFISKVATISSAIRSAESLVKYSQKQIDVSIIDSIGEWEEYKDIINPKIKIIKLNNKNYYKRLPRGSYIKSRLSYLIIFFLNFNKLKKLINKKKPDFLIIHLMTVLPIFLTLFFKNNTKIILRISGLPKLNFLRYFFWKMFANKIYKVTCPTVGTYNYLLEKKIFDKKKLHVLYDPAILMKDYVKKKSKKIEVSNFDNKKIIVGIGRLTKQKNFVLLISAFKEILKKYPNYLLIILGEGEQKLELLKLTKNLNIENKVYLVGHQENVYKYLINADCFILTSLWEDPGFVILEAGLSNTTVISSNCPNGPKEILDQENNGYLFMNNNKNELIKKFDEFKNEDVSRIYKKKKNLKKKLKKFTIYSHFKTLEKIINLEN
ncbi:MAG: hypothetical protein CMH24_00035 [Nitrosomonadales bacterium]|nr:hypothetical protein [Nitrosomonadales bacterium]|tara:strand:- start:5146 stop:6297 length:1152 start_codon:yes stop_codon:yes gene_type:complete